MKKNASKDQGSFLPLALLISTLLALTTLQIMSRAHEAQVLAHQLTPVAHTAQTIHNN